MGRRKGAGGDAKLAAGLLGEASAAEAGHVWAQLAQDEREPWVEAWRPVALAMRDRRALPLEDHEVKAIVRTQRRLEPAADGPPGLGLKEAAQMVIGLRLRQR